MIPPTQKHEVTALFGGVGGLELGLERAGHTTSLFCESDPDAATVLLARFPNVPIQFDVRKTAELAEAISPTSDLLTAGFPCTDFSQAGTTRGFDGGRSSLILDTIRLLKVRPFENVLLENVPNWRFLHGGAYLERVLVELEQLGYRWAYRTIDALAFGLPQRRNRLFLFATKNGDPREALFHGDERPSVRAQAIDQCAHGFYWTEGNRGLGWGEDCVPTLKGGSSVAIPSAPAILLSSLRIVTPDIRDCERLQGFAPDWTNCLERAAAVGGGPFRQRRRWMLVGNAINAEVANWIGQNLARRAALATDLDEALHPGEKWPAAAWFDGTTRRIAKLGPWPVRRECPPLEEFLEYPGTPLSLRATEGFYRRICASTLRVAPGFPEAVRAHAMRMSDALRLPDPMSALAVAS